MIPFDVLALAECGDACIVLRWILWFMYVLLNNT
jgi:hypothetical protein